MGRIQFKDFSPNLYIWAHWRPNTYIASNLCVGVLYHRFCAMDPSILAAMDKEALKKQIENMKYQASMERWPLSKSIAAWVEFSILNL